MKQNKIVITGGSGLVGSHLKKILPNAIYLSSKDYNLTSEKEVDRMYNELKPNCVIHLAARVGGIIDNIKHPAQYFTENVLMNTLLVEYAYKYNVERFIGILSTCIYPDKVENYPLTEDMLHLGPPTPTNFSYGYAKRCLAVQIDSYNEEYGTKYNYLTPCNLYGEGDKDGDNSHFVTALVKKIYDANTNGDDKITLFGDGTPIRQFLHVDDFCGIIKYVIDNDIFESFNVATTETLTINEIAKIAILACGKELKIEWDLTKPNGQHRKDVSIDKMLTIVKNYQSIRLIDGIKKVYNEYDKVSI
jgi:GDP-L-fucose synthase